MKRSGLSMAAMVATVVMVLTVSTYAITARAVNPVVGLSFQGTTAVCHAKCFAGSDSDNIQATLAVISLGQLAQSLTAAAAWIEEVRGNAVRKPDRSQHQRDIVRIGRVIAQLDVVHQAAQHGGIGLLPRGERSRELAQHLIDRLVACTHEIEAAYAPAKLSCHRCQFVLFQFQQK